jgi:phospholipid/cholesterol/gamma-HCH transport system permease protein
MTASTDLPDRLPLPEAVTREVVPELFRRHTPAMRAASHRSITLDLSAVRRMDSAGAGLLAHWGRALGPGSSLKLEGASEEIGRVLALYPRDPQPDAGASHPPAGFFEGLGERGYQARSSLVEFMVLLVDTFYFLPGTLVSRWRKRRALIVEEMSRIGSQSFGIVGVLSLLVGFTLALQAAYQLRQFGASIFIANLVGLSMMREMGPLLTAILLAGRIGSSTAAEIATRQITEEIDALRTMGLNPVEYVVVPKFCAITITGPLLSALATVIGIFGGYVVAILYLDLGHAQFMGQLLGSLYLRDFATGMIKAVSFSWAVILIGAHKGFSARGGPLEVGNATTSSVVVSLFSVIVLDAVYSMIFYFG